MNDMSPLHVFVLWLIGTNIAAFIAMVLDKSAAQARAWRISENTLVLLSFIGGSIGALAASRLVRHKTRKQPIATIIAAMPLFHGTMALIWAAGLWPSVLPGL